MAFTAPQVTTFATTKGTYNSGSGATKNATAAANIQEGDVLVVCGALALNTNNAVDVPGYNKVAYENGPNTVGAFAFRKVAEAADIDADVPVDLAGTGSSTAYIFHHLRITGATALDDFNVSARSSQGTTHTVQNTTSTYSDGLAIGICAIQDDNTNPASTTPGWTEIDNATESGSSAARSCSSFIASSVAPAGDTTDLIVTTSSSEFSSHIQLTITSDEAPPPLSIIEEPEDFYVGIGTRVEFKVGVIGFQPFGYQWYTASDDVAIPGATNSSYFYTVNADSEDFAVYCIVSDQGPVTVQTRDATIKRVGAPGYDGNAYRDAIQSLFPLVYYTLDEGDFNQTTGNFTDSSGNGNNSTKAVLVDLGEAGLVDDGRTSIRVNNDQFPSYIAIESRPDLQPRDFTVSVIVKPVGAYKTPYLYAPETGVGTAVARYGMGTDDFASGNLGDIWVTTSIDDEPGEHEHRQSNVVPTMPDPAVICEAQVHTITLLGRVVKFYADYQLVYEYELPGDPVYQLDPSDTLHFLGRELLSGGLEGYAQHLFLLPYAITDGDAAYLRTAYERSCARYVQPPIEPPAKRAAMVYNFEDDNYTWMDASYDNGTELESVYCMAYQFEPGWAARWSDYPDKVWNSWGRTEWSDLAESGREESMYWLTESGLYRSDQVIKTGGLKSYYVEREGMDFDDTNSLKTVKQFYFNIETEVPEGFTGENTFEAAIGWANSQQDDTAWQPSKVLKLDYRLQGGKVKWDMRSTGRYLAMRFDFTETQALTMTGGEIDIEKSYGR